MLKCLGNNLDVRFFTKLNKYLITYKHNKNVLEFFFDLKFFFLNSMKNGTKIEEEKKITI